MQRRVTGAVSGRLDGSIDRFWMAAVLFYGVGDAVTTGIGIHVGELVEAGPLVAPLVQRYGFVIFLPVKVGFLGSMYGLWLIAPRPQRFGVPLGLTFVGVSITVWNLSLLVATLFV